jgi:hypothetical protein
MRLLDSVKRVLDECRYGRLICGFNNFKPALVESIIISASIECDLDGALVLEEDEKSDLHIS